MANWNKLVEQEKKCPGCGAVFYAKPLKHNAKKFCSSGCYSNSRIGSHRSEETKEKMSRSITEALKDPVLRELFRKTGTRPRPELKGKKRDPEIAKRISETRSRRISEGKITTNAYGKHGSYVSSKSGETEYFHSSFELRRMKALDACLGVSSWTKRHGIYIPYGDKHYIPDFLVKTTDGKVLLEEVKGWVADVDVFNAKNDAAEWLCKQRGWEYRVLYEKDIDTVL